MSAVMSSIAQQAKYSGPLVRGLEAWRLGMEKTEGRKPDSYWHPSSICGCPTAAVYEQLGFPRAVPPHDARLLRIFDTGHAVHRMLQTQFIKAGMVPVIRHPNDPSKEVFAVEMPIQNEKHRLKGTLDIIFDLKGVRFVGEIKTKHSSAFAKMTSPEPKHLVQSTCYHKEALAKGWVNSDKATILYYSKDDSWIREFPVVISQQMMDDIDTKCDVMNNMVHEWNEKAVIPSPFYAESNKPPCRTCPWAQACHASLFKAEWTQKIMETRNAAPATPPPQAKASPAARAVPRKLPSRS